MVVIRPETILPRAWSDGDGEPQHDRRDAGRRGLARAAHEPRRSSP
jgi:hypothetical protein